MENAELDLASGCVWSVCGLCPMCAQLRHGLSITACDQGRVGGVSGGYHVDWQGRQKMIHTTVTETVDHHFIQCVLALKLSGLECWLAAS